LKKSDIRLNIEVDGTGSELTVSLVLVKILFVTCSLLTIMSVCAFDSIV